MPENARRKAKPKSELRRFETEGERLRRIYVKAESKGAKRPRKDRRPGKQPINQFKLAAYAYCQELVRADLIDELQAYVETRDGSQWAGHGDSPEQWVLRLVTRYEQTDSRRQRRRRIVAELALARSNEVRPELLLGFLYEAGPLTRIEKDAKVGKRYAWADAYR